MVSVLVVSIEEVDCSWFVSSTTCFTVYYFALILDTKHASDLRHDVGYEHKNIHFT